MMVEIVKYASPSSKVRLADVVQMKELLARMRRHAMSVLFVVQAVFVSGPHHICIANKQVC